MKVFISWSGDSSKAVAEALRDWLPCVIQAIKPWMSEHDLTSGSRSNLGLAKELSETRVGLICLTPDNLSAPWLLFEAGALSKTLDSNTLVCTYLVGLKPTDVSDPLGQFQATVADKKGTHKLLRDINEKLEERLAEEYLDMAFEALWPNFQEKLEAAANLKSVENPPRKDRELLEDILNIVRQLPRVGSERQGGYVDLTDLKAAYDAATGALAGESKGEFPTPGEMFGGAGARSNRLAEYFQSGASSNRSTQPVSKYKSRPIPQREK